MARIFISYRRKDSEVIAGRIYDRLSDVFGDQNVFKDVDDIPPGVDFRVVLKDKLAKSDAVLVIIGPEWVGIRNLAGNRRLDDPTDYTRIEVEQALNNSRLLVIPTLVLGASMPVASELPASIRDLTFRNAVQIRNDPDFNRDVERLSERLKVAPRRRLARISPLLISIVGILVVLVALYWLFLQFSHLIPQISLPIFNDVIERHYITLSSAEDWYDTGIMVQEGQVVIIHGAGEYNVWADCEERKREVDAEYIDCGSLVFSPDGGEARSLEGDNIWLGPDPEAPAPDLQKYMLIGRIGRHTFPAGRYATLNAPATGTLEFIVNDAGRDDNAGDIEVEIELLDEYVMATHYLEFLGEWHTANEDGIEGLVIIEPGEHPHNVHVHYEYGRARSCPDNRGIVFDESAHVFGYEIILPRIVAHCIDSDAVIEIGENSLILIFHPERRQLDLLASGEYLNTYECVAGACQSS